jgi:hypothetical protein
LTSAWIHITSFYLRRVQSCGMRGVLMEMSFMKFHEKHSVEIWWSSFDISHAMKIVFQTRTNGIIVVDVSSDGSFFATLSASKCPFDIWTIHWKSHFQVWFVRIIGYGNYPMMWPRALGPFEKQCSRNVLWRNKEK